MALLARTLPPPDHTTATLQIRLTRGISIQSNFVFGDTNICPSVDSDRDGSHNTGSGLPGSHSTHNTGSHNTGSGLTGSHNTHNTGTGSGFGSSNTAGPHSSNLANKADPRVDSDRDGSRNAGASNYGPGAHNTGSGIGSGNTHGGVGGVFNGNNGPHDTHTANVLDPRVDSDGSHHQGGLTGSHQQGGLTGSHQQGGLTGSHQQGGLTGSHQQGGLTGSHQQGGLTGSHQQGGLTGSHQQGGLPGTHQQGGLTGSHQQGGLTGSHQQGGQTGSHLDGPAPKTAGPHKSDMLNKLDPRVDSDRDGGKTIGKEPAPQY
ncbi:hypothetical protein EJ08DRAFT_644898 [Tothia fuscella]|uniref:Uncharacterized protein n=1 Tax=Tothia fuscella TaxID=1048955 RepID=A0A9P4U536_9PEZI|nr:hypothetical protein EJ08DRAFT_644898 [Tothia fuscella]